MNINTDNLMSVRNYALKVKKTTQYIYTLMAKGKIKSQSIDGIKFVVLVEEPKAIPTQGGVTIKRKQPQKA